MPATLPQDRPHDRPVHPPHDLPVPGLPTPLATRLEALARSLAAREDALGLLALGSVGQETVRADAWSDLDFFVLVRPGAKPRYLADLGWLEAAHPLAWAFQNTADGFKALMADGLLCEFAIFEPAELAAATYAPGRWAWRRAAEVPTAWAQPNRPLPAPRPRSWLLGEALSNLIVGLLRWRRGERLAAMRMVQVYAVDRLVELLDLDAPALPAGDGGPRPAAAPAAPGDPLRDPFSPERRVERRHPQAAALLAAVTPGLAHTPAAALALLDALQARAAVPPAVAARIRALAAG